MFFLPFDVSNNLIQIPPADSECAITALPFEMRFRSKHFVDEVRRDTLDLSHQVGDGNGRGNLGDEMHVIRHSIERKNLTLHLLDFTGAIAVKPSLNLRGDQRRSLPGRPDEMHVKRQFVSSHSLLNSSCRRRPTPGFACLPRFQSLSCHPTRICVQGFNQRLICLARVADLHIFFVGCPGFKLRALVVQIALRPAHVDG